MPTVRAPRSPARRPAVTAATAAEAVLLAVLATGCSGADPVAEGGPAPSSSTAPESSALPAPTAPTSESSGPSEPTGPAAATGPRLNVEALTVRVPDDFDLRESATPFDVSAVGRTGERGSLVQLVFFPLISGAGTLDEVAQQFLGQFESGGRIVGTPTVGGVEMARLRGMSSGVLTEKLVTEYDGDQYTITIGYDPTLEGDPAAQRELVDSVLASAQWR